MGKVRKSNDSESNAPKSERFRFELNSVLRAAGSWIIVKIKSVKQNLDCLVAIASGSSEIR